MDIIIGAGIFLMGYLTCFFTVKKQLDIKKEIDTTIKRIKPSLRNPMKTYTTTFEKYKSKEGLYTPQKAKSGDR